MAVTEETEDEVREAREKAVEYADKVLAGEEPWLDEQDEETDPNRVPAADGLVDEPRDDDKDKKAKPDKKPKDDDGGDTEDDDDKKVKAPRNDDVGETDSDTPDVIEVDQDNPAPAE